MEPNRKTVLVAGAAGFIGSHFVQLCLRSGFSVVALDLLTYAGRRENLPIDNELFFVRGDISSEDLVRDLFDQFHFCAVVNLAAESHVDRSIEASRKFIHTNILGTWNLLEQSRRYFESCSLGDQKSFRYLQVSTDEVYGALGDTGFFTEDSPYHPNSPYSASKAGADHLVRAWFKTYDLPTIVTTCSNNYGPRQYAEKFIPRLITRAIAGVDMPIYGSGQNVRDWIHVSDHCEGILLALKKGKAGGTYAFGGEQERTNLDVATLICEILQRKVPKSHSYKNQIRFVQDRKGHDWRYAIDDSKSRLELGFSRKVGSFEKALESTVDWYLDHPEFLKVQGCTDE
ncbi:MAG: dTDP-glucose 4,6-dehydratase [Proteobacteria bacterium]|nr:MAG: dTDP-glucose 4,6-dehydratase [Pseudomonadota bacterium]